MDLTLDAVAFPDVQMFWDKFLSHETTRRLLVQEIVGAENVQSNLEWLSSLKKKAEHVRNGWFAKKLSFHGLLVRPLVWKNGCAPSILIPAVSMKRYTFLSCANFQAVEIWDPAQTTQ